MSPERAVQYEEFVTMSTKRMLGFHRVVLGSVALAAVVAGPALAATSTPLPISGASPFISGCSGHEEPGTNYRGTEVEPWISVNPANSNNIVAAWQQDRWDNGGSHGLVNGVSLDGGTSWSTSYALFSRCALRAAGLSPDDPTQPGHSWDRATDPWVSFGRDGVVHQISDSFNVTGAGFGDGSAILYARSTDGGRTWARPVVLREDYNNTVLNDKETITADPNDARYVYAVWDRLESPPSGGQANPIATEHAIGYRGPTWFARSTDGGLSWERAHIILDPGTINQTIGNQIVVAPDGTLVNAFDLIYNVTNKGGRRGYNIAVQRSSDKGLTWSAPTVVAPQQTASVTTPGDGLPVRTGDIIPDIAVDRSGKLRDGSLYMVWQDGRFKADGTAAIAFSRSTNGGRTWSTPVRVDDAGTAQAFTPSVDVDASGRIAVSWYDFRNDTPDTSTALTDYWIRYSSDGGNTWTPSERVTPSSFDMKKAPDARGFFLGDYEGLDHAGQTFDLDLGITTGSTTPDSDIDFATGQ
jgi:BNR repeat-like domain